MEALKINNETIKASKSKSKSKSKASERKPSNQKRLKSADYVRAGSFFALALCGLGVSLPHLASEIGLLTGDSLLSAWLIALTVDLGMVSCKVQLSASGPAKLICWTVLGSCTLLSIILNCHAFLSHATAGFGQSAAVVFGIFLPLFILALSYVGSETLLGHRE